MFSFHHIVARRAVQLVALSFLACFALVSNAAASPDSDAIAKLRSTYVDAVNRRDVNAISQCWTADGDSVNELGQAIKGRDLAQDFVKSAGPETKISLTSTSLRFIHPDVAIDDGIIEFSPPPQGRIARAHYAATLVKNKGQWQIAAVREAPLKASSARTRLSGLRWMLGDWVATGLLEDSTIEVNCSWGAGGNFINRVISRKQGGRTELIGTQRIGWDAADGVIKSWFFEADGGYTEGQWTKEGDTWVVRSKGVDPEGNRLTATNVYKIEDANHFSLESTDTRSDQQGPSTFKLQLTRKPKSE